MIETIPMNTPPFIEELKSEFETIGFGWDIKGVIDSEKRIYTLTDDTKLISKVLELMTRPIVYEVAHTHELEVVEAQSQTIYPDFTLQGKGLGDKKLALDVKSTYRRFLARGGFRAGFTLGSYTSFLRTPTKNIQFHYDEYAAHWIIGFVYSRNEDLGDPQHVSIDQINEIVPPIQDIEIIFQEKYKIASDRPGSGNTTNIGSVKDIEQLREGTGPFAQCGEAIFEDYWRHYITRARAQRRGVERSFSDLESYFRWRIENPSDEVELPPEVIEEYKNQSS